MHAAELISALGGQAIGGEHNLARRARAEYADEARDAARVVAKPEPGRGDREESIFRSDPQIATCGHRRACAHAAVR